MFRFEIQPAIDRLVDAVQFKRKAGLWFPDTLVDRRAVYLSGVKFKPSGDADEILEQFSNVCFCQFNGE